MQIPELVPGGRLAALIAACETYCEHACCGLEAFHFSPLHVAAHLSRYTGKIDPNDAQEVLRQLDALVLSASGLDQNDQGWICTIQGTNQRFSAESLSRFAARVRLALASAPAVLALSDKIELTHDDGLAASEA